MAGFKLHEEWSANRRSDHFWRRYNSSVGLDKTYLYKEVATMANPKDIFLLTKKRTRASTGIYNSYWSLECPATGGGIKSPRCLVCWPLLFILNTDLGSSHRDKFTVILALPIRHDSGKISYNFGYQTLSFGFFGFPLENAYMCTRATATRYEV